MIEPVESAWDRAAPFACMSLAEVNERLDRWGCRAVSVELLKEGHANTNHKVELADGSLAVLRKYQRDPQSQGLEIALAERLFPPAPIPRVLAYDLGTRESLIEWRGGQSMQSLIEAGLGTEVQAAAEDLGRVLATISSVRFPSAGFLSDRLDVLDPWPSGLDGLLGYLDMSLRRPILSQRTTSTFATQVKECVERNRSRLQEVAGPPCLSHGDFKASNLLLQDGCVSAVLDWEFAHSGTWLLGAGQVLRHRHALPAGFGESFAAGYREIAELPDDWVQLAQVVDLVNLVDFLGREHASAPMLSDVQRIVEETVRK